METVEIEKFVVTYEIPNDELLQIDDEDEEKTYEKSESESNTLTTQMIGIYLNQIEKVTIIFDKTYPKEEKMLWRVKDEISLLLCIPKSEQL